jgi:hypothetical protein
MSFISDTDNTIAALEQSNRVCEVYLDELGGRQLEEVLAAMQVPFPELTRMELTYDTEETRPPVIPDSFLGGSAPRLRHFLLFGIPFPGLPNLLLSATHLVDLDYSGIPHSGYISPEAIVVLISVLSSLKIISLEFRSFPFLPISESQSLPPPNRSILPALSKLVFRGVSEYLDELVTRIDTPQLDRMDITVVNQIGTPRLAQFINRTSLGAGDKARVDHNVGIDVELLAPVRNLRISMSSENWMGSFRPSPRSLALCTPFPRLRAFTSGIDTRD